MNKPKQFDCVQMKWNIQKQIAEEFAGVPEEKAQQMMNEQVLDDPILGPFLKKVHNLPPRQVAATYTVQVLSPEEVAQQETDYTNLLQTWQTASTSKIEEILATRELVEPEPELRPEIVAKLKQKMALRQTP